MCLGVADLSGKELKTEQVLIRIRKGQTKASSVETKCYQTYTVTNNDSNIRRHVHVRTSETL